MADLVHDVATAAELQAALTAAQANGKHDLIRIAEGTYHLSENGGAHFTYLAAAGEDKDLVLEGGWTPDFSQRAYNLPTILEYDLLLVYMDNGGVLSLDGATNATTGSFTVDGLTINGGYATGSGGGPVRGHRRQHHPVEQRRHEQHRLRLRRRLLPARAAAAASGSRAAGSSATTAMRPGAGVVRAPNAYVSANEVWGNAAADGRRPAGAGCGGRRADRQQQHDLRQRGDTGSAG